MIHAYIGGTTGGTDGTLYAWPLSGMSAEAREAVTLRATNDVVTIHLRDDGGQQNAEAFDYPAPTDCEVSADGITYAASVEFGAGDVGDVNVPVYVKRTATTTTSDVGVQCDPRLDVVTTEDIPDTTAPTLSGTLTATPGDTQVTLSGLTATDDVGIAKWQYRIGAGAWVDIAESANGTMPSTVVGSLDNGTEYSFTARALDAATNASDASAAATATPADTTAPGLTGTLTATPGNGQVVLDWNDATGDVTGYDVEYGTTNEYGTVVSPDPTDSTCTITGLTNDTLYYFRVRAHDEVPNNSDWITATATPASSETTLYLKSDNTLTTTPNTGFTEFSYANGVRVRIGGGTSTASQTVPSGAITERTYTPTVPAGGSNVLYIRNGNDTANYFTFTGPAGCFPEGATVTVKLLLEHWEDEEEIEHCALLYDNSGAYSRVVVS